MSATPKIPGQGVAVCNTVDDRIGGPGGIWLEQEGDLVPPSAPQLTSTDPASPGSSGTPRILGAAEVGSTVRVYAGPACAGMPVATGSAAELGSPGISIKIEEGITAAFSATATDAADNASACSEPIPYARLKATPDPGGRGEDPPPPPAPACIVPELAGKSLSRAKAELKAAGCAVGKVTKPKARKGRKLGPLVVKSSKPSTGTLLEVGGKVNLKLRKPRR